MESTIRYCQALDLVDNQKKILYYEDIHKKIWPEVAEHIRHYDIINMQIWHIGNRLFMIIDVRHNFSFERTNQMTLQKPHYTKMGRTNVELSTANTMDIQR